ncbi:F-box/FBD/LRR-repeat protein At5g22660 [Lactuca sativa]|uniref:F-box/FBD/LRR-repeat protein At5g22660 n=1 Tax=Lactuca sativa TaxID=4236 RepID=UPI000CD8948B|nr:F-box/FBD/LRR-repeat protein At5g22660 [Lactuca sativa]
MELSKKVNASKHEYGVDKISSLPNLVLQLVLSSLPTTEEVIRTSILSTRWKYVWTSIPSIDIDCSRGSEFSRNKFKKFVDRVLAKGSLDLEGVCLCCSDHYSMQIVQKWIHAVVKRNIKQLHLLFCCGHWLKSIHLPDCLMTCGSLEVFRLYLYKRRLNFLKLTGFSGLRVLELNNFELAYDSVYVYDFLKGLPLLEDLSLIDYMMKKLVFLCISCPNLKNLRLDNRNISELYNIESICGCIEIVCPKLVFFEFGAFEAYKYIFKSLVSLKKVAIHSEDFPYEYMERKFRGNGLLESLSTSIDIFCFSLYPSVVPNLKTLELTTGIHDSPIISKLIRFLTRLPQLESLNLIIEDDHFLWEDWKLDEAERRGILTRHLKTVEFLNFYKEKLILDLARCLLEHGDALEEMIFRRDCEEDEFHERSMETMNQVSKFHKASSNVKLITLNEINYYQLSGKPGKP